MFFGDDANIRNVEIQKSAMHGSYSAPWSVNPGIWIPSKSFLWCHKTKVFIESEIKAYRLSRTRATAMTILH